MLIVEVPQQDHVGQEPPEALGNESFSCLSEAHITAGRVVLLFCYAILHGCIVVQENPAILSYAGIHKGSCSSEYHALVRCPRGSLYVALSL